MVEVIKLVLKQVSAPSLTKGKADFKFHQSELDDQTKKNLKIGLRKNILICTKNIYKDTNYKTTDLCLYYMGEQQSKIFDIDWNIVVNLGIKCNTLEYQRSRSSLLFKSV